MRKIKRSMYVITLIIALGILSTFAAPTIIGVETSKSPASLVADEGNDSQLNSAQRELKGFWKKLSKEQRKILHTAIKAAKDRGAGRKEIRALINKYLKDWGFEQTIKLPKGFWKKLTKAQKKELRQGIMRLKKQGASRKRIKSYIKSKLDGWGID